VTGQFTSGVAPVVADLSADVREQAEGGLGGVFGLIRQGEIPSDLVGPLVDTAKRSFVDGLGLAATVAAVIVAGASVVVYRYLPSDRNRPQVSDEPEPTGTRDLTDAVAAD